MSKHYIHTNNSSLRKCLRSVVAMLSCCLLFTACDTDELTYTGRDYVQWADSVTVLPIVDNDSVFTLSISAMRTSNHDRTVAVELLDSRSNARAGYHYDLLDHIVVIPAGELTTSVRVRGYHDHLQVGDSLGFVLNLLVDSEVESPIYGTQMRVLLQKAKRFDIHDFEGWAMVQSTWQYYYMNDEQRVVRIEIDPEVTNRIIIRDFYYEGYDVHLDLTDDDLLNPILHFETQVFAPTVEAFGTIYGNGKIMMSEPAGYVSYYSSLERFLYLFTTNYVENVGTVGTFVHALKYISDDEALDFIGLSVYR